MSWKENAAINPYIEQREPVSVRTKADESMHLLYALSEEKIREVLTLDNLVDGTIPRLSPFDQIPEGIKLTKIPEDEIKKLEKQRSYDLIRWNNPEAFLKRLNKEKKGKIRSKYNVSPVMEDLLNKKEDISFADIRLPSPEQNGSRASRKENEANIEHIIMGKARIPFAMGSMPDVGSALAYVTMAMSGGLAFIARDKILADIDLQVDLVKNIIDFLKNVNLPPQLIPNNYELKQFWEIVSPNESFNSDTAMQRYMKQLRESWIANIAIAIEASDKGVERAKKAYDVGCKVFRVYSPEGGREIVTTVNKLNENLKAKDNEVKIVAGQVMHVSIAQAAVKAGADMLCIGVGGGRQCTTPINADIPVNTPNLLYSLRRAGIDADISIEGGGVGKHLITAFAMGADLLHKAGEIGISWEGIGGKYGFKDSKGNWYTMYDGEASDPSKWWRDLLDDLGRIQFPEGESSFINLGKKLKGLTDNIRLLRHHLAVGLVFHRISENSVQALQSRGIADLEKITVGVNELSGAYGS